MAIFTRIIRKSTLVLSFVLSVSSCSDNSTSEEFGEEMSGEKLYAQKCTSCHGKNGNLGVSGAADLSTSGKSIEEKIAIIQKGSSNSVMQPYGEKFGGSLNDTQIQILAEYIETLKK